MVLLQCELFEGMRSRSDGGVEKVFASLVDTPLATVVAGERYADSRFVVVAAQPAHIVYAPGTPVL